MSGTILAVDDSRIVRAQVHAALRDAGFVCHLAGDGAEALAALSRLRPDAIVTDIEMPRLDGIGFIQGVRTRHELAGIPILVMSSLTTPAVLARARENGAAGWLAKPVDAAALVGTMRRLCAHSRRAADARGPWPDTRQ